jgi:biotin carboxylase
MVAKKLGLVGPDPAVIVGHQHKYYSRLWQQQYVPEATPSFWLIDPYDIQSSKQLALPIFLKPVKSFFSMLANEIRTKTEFMYWIEQAQFPVAFLEPFNWFLKKSSFDLQSHYLIAEEVLRGEQCTIEGFVHNGEVGILGVTDSIMFPGTISFKRFEYPSHLPQSVQDRMEAIAATLMKRTGFDNGFFNIEFMYDPKTDRLAIIEVNPRAASQFADLYEKVDGVNSYQYLVQLAVGKKPVPMRRKGIHTIAGSCVLRTFENKRVRKAPGSKELERLYTEFPDARVQIFHKKGDLLSDALQDGKSYRYGLVHLGAGDSQELQEKFEYCQKLLDFQFEAI